MQVTLANQTIAQAGGQIQNPALSPSLQLMAPTLFFQGLLRGLINLGFIVGAVVFIFMFLIGGIQWITSGGDKANVEAARSRLTTAIIGLVILFALFAIIKVVEAFFGTDILLLDIPGLAIQ